MQTLKNLTNQKYWWIYLIVGILITLVGVFFVTSPLLGLVIEALLIEILFLVVGIGGILSSITSRKTYPLWSASLVFFIILTILGIILISVDGLDIVLIIVFTTVGFLFEGIGIITKACTLKGEGWGFTLALGIIVTLSALCIMGDIVMGFALAVVFETISIISFGISCITLSIQIKNMPQ